MILGHVRSTKRWGRREPYRVWCHMASLDMTLRAGDKDWAKVSMMGTEDDLVLLGGLQALLYEIAVDELVFLLHSLLSTHGRRARE